MAGKEEIRISVVIAAYNAGLTIARAVDSCLHQSVLPFEIIVVNDGSLDETAALLKNYGAQISVFTFKENKGPSAARNEGIRQAKGNFIAFLDADDHWLPDKIKVVKEVLAERGDVRFLFHDFVVQPNIDKERRSGDRQPGTPGPETGRNELQLFSFRKMLIRNPMSTPCVVVKNQEGLQFNENLRYLEDYELWLRLAEVQKVWHLPMPLTVLGRPVLSAGGQSSNRWEMRKGELKVYTQLALRKKSLLPLLPLLWTYSLLKHVIRLGRR